jgi:tRNA(fMet)-specific endonuclease VapC
MAYVFDTDVLSSIIARQPNIVVARRLAAIPDRDQATTSISLGELLFGALRRRPAAILPRIETLVDHLAVLPFDESAARIYAEIKAELEAAGAPLAEPDLRIASIVRAYGLILVTGNERHFRRVPDLVVENWLVAESR